MTGGLAKQQALGQLLQAVEAIRPHLRDSDQRAALALIEDTAARLTDPAPAQATGMMDFDASRLAHLLDLTGPALAVELLARLTEDLVATRAKLDLGAETEDWKRIREGSHVLISLAGSVGALSLQAMSETLNALAHQEDTQALASLMPTLRAELASLIQLIRTTQPPAARF